MGSGPLKKSSQAEANRHLPLFSGVKTGCVLLEYGGLNGCWALRGTFVSLSVEGDGFLCCKERMMQWRRWQG